MLSKGCQRHHSFLEPLKLAETKKKSTSGTLSPDTITTTSSGYSTGGSSVSTKIVPSLKEHKLKTKSIYNLITKLKNFIISPKPKLIHSTTSNDMPSAIIHRQYSTSYDISSSTVQTSNTMSLPFTYYQKPPIKKFDNNNNNKIIKESYITKTTNFDQISAWLDHTELMTKEKQDDIDLLFIDEIKQESIRLSPIDIDYKITMKKTSMNNRTPRRSTSLVSTMSRPIIEQKYYEKSISPTSSFSSSILARGMSENMTPQQKTYHSSRTNLTEEQTNNLLSKSNRRRAIDFNRRRTLAGPTEQINNNNNKENLSNNNHRQQIYRFSPSSTSTNQLTKKYYFHSNLPKKNEDILMNSYGLTLLQQQKRQSISSNITIPRTSENTSIKQLNRRPSTQLIQQECRSDSLDDLLCDREVESYFYPSKRQSSPQHIYINLEPSQNYYQPPLPCLHGTLC